MNLKKPKFWDYKKPNLYAYLLFPFAYVLKILNLFKKKTNKKQTNLKTICVGNIYIGGTGKTSLSIKINEILNKKKIKSCFIKKFYKDQID
jgi:tetraacyldisaccharide 4'-kinase